METETIASRNVVDLLLNEEFGSGICGSRISASEKKHSFLREAIFNSKMEENFVVGWDC
jgi:prenylcysteine oxidase/farnesylcysteine lyase